MVLNDSSLVVSGCKMGTSVQFIQQVIPDDPKERNLAIKKIVLMCCKNALFSDKHSSVQSTGLNSYSFSGKAPLNGRDCNQKEENESVELKNLCVEPLSGGITNELFRVYSILDSTSSVVVRCFGKETERVVSRESELFYQSVFIPTYARGTNFLIYKFFDMYKALTFTDLPIESSKIAAELSSFHVQATLEAMRDFKRPYMTEEEQMYWGPVEATFTNGSVTSYNVSRFHREENYTLHALRTWVDQLFSESILKKVNKKKFGDYINISKQLKHETKWMVSLLQRHASCLGECVCHNDLLAANIMRHKTEGFLKIIDFDYVRRNYFLFDIANHFNEYAGLDCDYANYFPSDDDMEKFISVYRKNMLMELQKRQMDVSFAQKDKITLQQNLFLSFWTDNNVEEQETIARWVRLVKLLTLSSHLCWSVWALLQEAISELDVDFLTYSKCRLTRYFETKDEFSAGFT